MESAETSAKSGDESDSKRRILKRAALIFEKSYTAPLGTTASSEEAAERAKVLHEVARLDDSKSREFLYDKIHDLDLRVRRTVYEELAQRGIKEDIERLEKLKNEDPILSNDSAYIWDAIQKLRKRHGDKKK